MQIALIGMSGVGKSHWSGILESHGYRRYFCDAMIEARLAPLLVGTDGIQRAMGRWMGFPFDPGYREREETYLAHEIEVMTAVLDRVEQDELPGGKSFVIDTTGSVIYTGPDILNRLAALTRIVYLEAPAAVQTEMQTAYRAKPAPVLWRENFRKGPDETGEAALARCYPNLLAARSRAYRKLAHITLDYYLLRSESFGAAEFIEAVG